MPPHATHGYGPVCDSTPPNDTWLPSLSNTRCCLKRPPPTLLASIYTSISAIFEFYIHPTNMMLLISSLQDLENFHSYISSQYRLTSYNKWVLHGGSYPGALSAWGRSKVDNLTNFISDRGCIDSLRQAYTFFHNEPLCKAPTGRQRKYLRNLRNERKES